MRHGVYPNKNKLEVVVYGYSLGSFSEGAYQLWKGQTKMRKQMYGTGLNIAFKHIRKIEKLTGWSSGLYDFRDAEWWIKDNKLFTKEGFIGSKVESWPLDGWFVYKLVNKVSLFIVVDPEKEIENV